MLRFVNGRSEKYDFELIWRHIFFQKPRVWKLKFQNNQFNLNFTQMILLDIYSSKIEMIFWMR